MFLDMFTCPVKNKSERCKMTHALGSTCLYHVLILKWPPFTNVDFDRRRFVLVLKQSALRPEAFILLKRTTVAAWLRFTSMSALNRSDTRTQSEDRRTAKSHAKSKHEMQRLAKVDTSDDPTCHPTCLGSFSGERCSFPMYIKQKFLNQNRRVRACTQHQAKIYKEGSAQVRSCRLGQQMQVAGLAVLVHSSSAHCRKEFLARYGSNTCGCDETFTLFLLFPMQFIHTQTLGQNTLQVCLLNELQ